MPEQGMRGERGPRGDHGQTGDDGVAGETGKAGDTGPQGAKGETPRLGHYFWPRLGLIVIVFAVGFVGTAGQLVVSQRELASVTAELQRQSLAKEAEALRHHIRSEETSDCGPRYLKDLLAARAGGRNFEDVPLPPRCEPADLDVLRAELEQVERRLADE